jgi:hypothetical protein
MKSQVCQVEKLPFNYLWDYLASRALNEINTYQTDLAIDDMTGFKKKQRRQH